MRKYDVQLNLKEKKKIVSLSHNFQRRILLSIKCSDYSVSSLYNQHEGSISAIIMHLVREIPSHKDTYRPYTLIQKASFAKVILNPCRNVGQFVFYKIHCQVKHRPHITSCSTTNELSHKDSDLLARYHVAQRSLSTSYSESV